MNKLLISLVVLLLSASANANDDVMRVHFIDVGQGDATLIEFPNGVMLIDAGGEDSEFNGGRHLMRYLKRFFRRRQTLADRDHPIDLLAITHAHKDHTRMIPDIIDKYAPANIIHNNRRTGSGAIEQNLAIDYIRQGGAKGYYILEDRAVTKARSTGSGISNPIIDPFGPTSTPSQTDPMITLLWGGIRREADWLPGDFNEGNNHSLVIRVDYGDASVLFTGDLEESEDQGQQGKAGIERIVESYKTLDVLDVDVYQVGHHASSNGGSNDLMDLVTPEYAVISCGPPVRRRQGQFNAFNFGHPRKETISELTRVITTPRNPAIDAKYFTRPRQPLDVRIDKAIYCTGWDGTIVMEGNADGDWKITRLHGNPAFVQ